MVESIMVETPTIKQREWQERFEECTKGIEHLSTGSYIDGCGNCPKYNDTQGIYAWEQGVAVCEPFFSWNACEGCRSGLGGNREVAHGFLNGHMIHMYVCVDCVIYIANGDLPSDENL